MPRRSRRARRVRRESRSNKMFLNFLAWITGVIISLSVGFAMIGGTLTVPYWIGGSITAVIAGWVVVVATFIGIITAIFSK